MRKVLFIAMALLCCLVSQGQKKSNERHTSLADCGGDTLRYIRENFVEKQHRYAGVKMDSLFNDLEIPIKRFGITPEGRTDQVGGMIIKYYSGKEEEVYMKQGKRYYFIYVNFQNPGGSSDEFYKLGGVYWKEKHRNYLKNFIIKDFTVWDRLDNKVLK